jgi:hypothetical protein
MPDETPIPPIDPGELLYRRVHEFEYKPLESAFPEFSAFMPNKHDKDGLSFYRERLKKPRDVAIGPRAKSDKKYYVAVIPASALIELGLTIATDDEIPPEDGPPDPAHATVSELNAGVKGHERTIDLAKKVSVACVSVLGPFTLQENP